MNDSKENIDMNNNLEKNDEEEKSLPNNNKEMNQKISNDSDASEKGIPKHLDEIEHKIIEDEKEDHNKENLLSIIENKNNPKHE